MKRLNLTSYYKQKKKDKIYKTSFGYNWQCKTRITGREVSEMDLTIASEFCLDKPMSKERLSRAYYLV